MKPPSPSQEQQAWLITEVAPDFELLDAWALPAEGERGDFEAFLETISSIDPAGGSFSLTRALFWVRLRLGTMLGWDDAAKVRRIPGSIDTTLRERLPAHLRATADGPLFGGTIARAAVLLYRTETEAATEVANDTVHGVLHLGWVEQSDGRYHAQLGIYVKPRGRLGRSYLALIKPFRHLVVYPALVRRIGRAWAERPGPIKRDG